MNAKLESSVRSMMIEAGITGSFSVHDGSSILHGHVGQASDEDRNVMVIVTPIGPGTRVSIASDLETPADLIEWARTGR